MRYQAALPMLIVLILGGCGTEEPAGERECNGSAANCLRRYDQVTFAATHNAFSYAAGGDVRYLFPNQDLPIADQLRAGIRGLGIRPCPYYGDDPAESGRVYVTHNFDLMGLLGFADERAQLAAYGVDRSEHVAVKRRRKFARTCGRTQRA